MSAFRWVAVFAVPLVFGCRSLQSSETKALSPWYAAVLGDAKVIGDAFQRGNYLRRNVSETGKRALPAVRAAFQRTVGCVAAEFEVLQVPEELSRGLFSQPRVYDAMVRVSRDRTDASSEDDFDLATLAFAIKLPKQLGVPQQQDFILQNHDRFFAATSAEFVQLLEGSLDPEVKKDVDRVLDQEMRKSMGNVLRQDLWSVTPYSYGETHAKYRIRPQACPDHDEQLLDEAIPEEKNPATIEFLNQRFERDMSSKPACFSFEVQLSLGEEEEGTDGLTPIDNARKRWNAKLGFLKVANVTFLPWEFESNSPLADQWHHSCQLAVFDPWNTLPAHRPVGSINEVRRIIYDRFARCRDIQNNDPDTQDEWYLENCLSMEHKRSLSDQPADQESFHREAPKRNLPFMTGPHTEIHH